MDSHWDNIRFNQLDPNTLLQFNFVSAALRNFLPSKNAAKHFLFYKQLMSNLQVSQEDPWNNTVLDRAIHQGTTTEIENCINNGPLIICTFHCGSYRLLNQMLARRKAKVSLLLNAKVMAEQGNDFLRGYKENSGEDGLLELIDADSARSAISILKAISSQRVVVAYLDGNTGAGENANENKNNSVISFLGGKIFVRSGLAYLSYKSHTPILTVVASKTAEGSNILNYFPLIRPMPGEGKDKYINETLQKIYSYAESIIVQHPEQWEGWLYLHKAVAADELSDSDDPSLIDKNLGWFNDYEYGVFTVGNDHFLFQKATYSFFKIDSVLYERLMCLVSYE